MRYVLADWVKIGKVEYTPDLPADCKYIHLASSSWNCDFGIFKITANAADDKALLDRAVPHSLAVLLSSAEQYRPALAGAAYSIKLLKITDKELFLTEFERLLRERFEAQRTAKYVMIRSLIAEGGFRYSGEYVWVVDYSPECIGEEVTWISNDYLSYSDSVKTFDIDPNWLAERFHKSS